jgi:hypothetical protein
VQPIVCPCRTRFALEFEAPPITETCGDTKRTIDALKATRLEIAGADTLKVGATSDHYAVKVFAGDRPLRGVEQGNKAPDWQLDKDCDGIATFGPVLGAQDTGGADISRTLVTTKAGSCTLEASVLGIATTKTVAIK